MRAKLHPFVQWLQKQDNPLFAVFASDYGDLLPPTGDRETLRAVVKANDKEPDPRKWDGLNLFDVAWHKFQPTCEAPDCNRVVDIQRSLCSVHSTMAELL